MKIFSLVDCNSFYASCEKVFSPALKNKPVVVLSNNDGCVVARSSEAKALKIKMGVPYFKIKDLCDRGAVTAFSSNYALYGDMSTRVMNALKNFSPKMEVYSIDEAFLDLTGTPDALNPSFGGNLIDTITKWTGIPVSVGIGPTKTLAKIANRIAKHKNTGYYSVMDETIRTAHLDETPVDGIWGISGRWGAKLRRIGISTAGNLRDSDTRYIKKKFSIVMERIVRELRGEPCIELEAAPPPKKQIQVGRSFGKRVSSLSEIREAVVSYAARAAEKMRTSGLLASGIYVYVRTNPFADAPQYANAAAREFPIPTSDTFEIVSAAAGCVEKIYRSGFSYKKCGVMLLDLKPESSCTQQYLFDLDKCALERAPLFKAVDSLNASMGKNTVFLASQGIERTWTLRAELRSPRYTTRWEELPTAKAD